jgi:hypothetical protein
MDSVFLYPLASIILIEQLLKPAPEPATSLAAVKLKHMQQ